MMWYITVENGRMDIVMAKVKNLNKEPKKINSNHNKSDIMKGVTSKTDGMAKAMKLMILITYIEGITRIARSMDMVNSLWATNRSMWDNGRLILWMDMDIILIWRITSIWDGLGMVWSKVRDRWCF